MTRSNFFAVGDARFRFGILCIFLVLCALGGGASRPDTLSLLYVRPAAVIVIACLILSPGHWHFDGLKPAFIILAALAGLMLLQLIPLPPSVWLSLPGHARFAEAAAAAGLAQPWRPISLTPDMTINSLLALLPALACLVGMASLGRADRQRIMPVTIGIVCAAMLLGIVQLTGGGQGPAYLYRVTHEASAVGLFANRNHQGTLLAMAFPMLRIWQLSGPRDGGARRRRNWIAGGIALLLIPMLLVTGSRTGIAIGCLGLASVFLIAPVRLPDRLSGWWRGLIRLGVLAVPIAIGLLVFLFGRATAIQRLFSNSVGEDARVQLTPTSWSIAQAFFPFGTGFGSFDTVFRIFEPNWSLERTYFNHAHNDFLEIVITAGAPGAIFIMVVLAWFVRRSLGLWRAPEGTGNAVSVQRGAFFMLLCVILASIVDYPLRTPLMSAIVAIVGVWFLESRDIRDAAHGGMRPNSGKLPLRS
jgi:O-antigen ligase